MQNTDATSARPILSKLEEDDLEEDEPIYIKPPHWWFEPVPEGHVLQWLKAVYGTVQAARRWHTKISTWMEDNDYRAVNSVKTIFLKRDGKEFIVHGIFVDDMKNVPTACQPNIFSMSSLRNILGISKSLEDIAFL